jgi:hypothetical protein
MRLVKSVESFDQKDGLDSASFTVMNAACPGSGGRIKNRWSRSGSHNLRNNDGKSWLLEPNSGPIIVSRHHLTHGGIKPSSLLPRSPNNRVRRSARWPYASFARSPTRHASLAWRVRPGHGCRQSNTCCSRLFGRLVLCTLT